MTNAPFSLCVYCGSRHGTRPAYTAAARALRQAIGSPRAQPPLSGRRGGGPGGGGRAPPGPARRALGRGAAGA